MSKHYPKVWRIDDWEDPWLPLPIRLFNKLPDRIAQSLFKLDEEHLLRKARKLSGLSCFGEDNFLGPLRILLKDIETLNHFTPIGRFTAHTILIQNLCAKLRIEDRFINDPSLNKQQIAKPVIIAGLPRTGTTHLHNLLSQPTRLRYIPLWQTMDPLLPLGETKDRRQQFSDHAVKFSEYMVPLFRRMHEMETHMPHEELTLCAMCFRSLFYEGTFQASNYRQWYANNDQTEGYQFLRKILQLLQAESPPVPKHKDCRWVLKSPQHLDQLTTILKVFPDAKIVLTHREPVHAVLSMITMMLYSNRVLYRPDRRFVEARAWVDRLEQMLRSSLEQVERLPKEQIYHVKFTEFMADQKGTINKISAFADIELDEESSRAIDAHLQSHTRDRHGRIDYNFEDLNLNKEEIIERFRFYTSHL